MKTSLQVGFYTASMLMAVFIVFPTAASAQQYGGYNGGGFHMMMLQQQQMQQQMQYMQQPSPMPQPQYNPSCNNMYCQAVLDNGCHSIYGCGSLQPQVQFVNPQPMPVAQFYYPQPSNCWLDVGQFSIYGGGSHAPVVRC